MEPKPWFTSKLNWQAIFNMVAGIALYLAGDTFVKDYAPALIPVFIFVNGMIQMIIRTFFTKAEVAHSLTGTVPAAQQLRVEQEARKIG